MKKTFKELRTLKFKESNKDFSEFMYEKANNNQHQAIYKRMIKRGTLKIKGKKLKS